MKKLFISLCLLIITTSIYAQAPEKLSYQAIIRDASDALVINASISVQISIVQGSATGTTVYSEVHNPMTNFTGVVSLLIGDGTVVSGSLNGIDWGSDSYFIRTETDPAGGTNYNIVGTSQLLSTSFGLTSKNTDRALSIDYNNLTNTPTTITTEQSDKVNFLSITSAVDLNQILTTVSVNTAKTSFPGFGTTTGTAFDIIWSKIGDHVYYDTAKVGIGFTDATAFGNAVLGVKDGITLSNMNDEVAQATPGSLFYEGSAKGFMFYYDNTGTLKSLGTGDITFNTRNNVFIEESIVKNRVAIGDDVMTGMDFGENDMILSDDTIGIWFRDTSVSASFPTNDWVIKINDISDNGENYFAVLDTTANRIPFRVMAGAPDKSLEINANGNINVGNLIPTEKIEVDGSVAATSFVGSGANLTNLTGTGTATTSNIGSTTIGADNDADTNGSIIFETEQNIRMRIESDGSVNNGIVDPSNLLSINGDANFTDLTAQTLSVGGAVQTPVFTETSVGNFTGYDLTNKSIVLINNGSSVTVFGFIGGVTGQKVHLINIHPTTTITIFPSQVLLPASLGNPVLNQNESISLIYNGSNWVVTDFVGTP
ncbi:hypothetical protein D1815_00365 [Aquimarina sp. AD1]|uniref:hypothetical protein n=1 Tax=Aquimarina sp. (strain AD1) TaxID=1714848 RepID=UPI000E48A3B7|nr:hypothetical protein [Aquimarina sp. AD1]AXT54264.1 hypothetical protein D1815_00365 [Aquimarina sp. AD1]